ncbi:MAG: hypothetical protein EZS28_022311 [Streblomastix strix]|uniref:Reverse transcriptase domain-containing protein n=1 Tax=Streblomastix strix TaxID=222440 RepID=A0A5J4VHX4_9EUKA|nr:MAG: hypothetical protein EZS28_022311 [Streblomastix strix]
MVQQMLLNSETGSIIQEDYGLQKIRLGKVKRTLQNGINRQLSKIANTNELDDIHRYNLSISPCYIAMPFGVSLASRVFDKNLKPVIEEIINRQKLKTMAYAHDVILMSEDKERRSNQHLTHLRIGGIGKQRDFSVEIKIYGQMAEMLQPKPGRRRQHYNIHQSRCWEQFQTICATRKCQRC